MGYTFAVNHGGPSIHAMMERDLHPMIMGQDPGRIEALWEKMWWNMHYPGRGGIAAFAIAAVDIALWDLRGKSTGLPLWRLLGGHNAKVPAYAGGIDLMLPLDELIAQTDQNIADGFQGQEDEDRAGESGRGRAPGGGHARSTWARIFP